MEKISIDLIREIRDLINDVYIQRELMNFNVENWLKMTSALDTIEDSASAVEFYLNNEFPSEYGGQYLYLYGLLQSLCHTQDCISTMRSIYDKKIEFNTENEEIYYVRNIRNDILHATNRKQPETRYIYLTQISLSKNHFSYFKLTKEAKYIPYNIDVIDLITKNNKGINKFLQEIKIHFENELKKYKQEHNKMKLSEIFTTTNYFFEKIFENPELFDAAYKTLKDQLEKYKCELSKRNMDWQTIDSDKYIIDMIEKIYYAIDNGYLEDIKSAEVRKDVKEVLLLHLRTCYDELRNNANSWDEYFEDIN